MVPDGLQPNDERKLPFDKVVKLLFLSLHFIGFSIWYGGLVLGVEVAVIYPAMAVVTGVVLTFRELYGDGLDWLFETEGVLMVAKVLLLIVVLILGQFEVAVLTVVMLCGLLGSHLPDHLKKRQLIPRPFSS